jgi:anti-sigma B factor antagonist
MGVVGSFRKGVRALGRMLVGEKLVTEDQVQEALGHQARLRRRSGERKPLGEILVERQAISRSEVERVLATQECALRVETREAGDGVLVLDLVGYVDGDTHDVLDVALQSAAREGHSRLVLDATRLDYMNSDGVGAILPAARAARENGGDLKIVGLHGKAAAIFEVIGLERFFQLFEKEEQALAAFRQPTPADLVGEVALAYVASNKGRTYHRPDCRAAAKISIVNVLNFYSREEAEASGRKPCRRCCTGGGE